MFEMKLLGYIFDEEEVIPTINRTMVSTEVASLLPSNVITDFAVSTNGVVLHSILNRNRIHNLPYITI
jgi:hypothetical protein